MDTKVDQAIIKPDRREQPAYPLAEAARYLKLPVATLRSWVVGRHYPRVDSTESFFSPLIEVTETKPLYLSFWNLIEAHVLRSLRMQHRISIKQVRQAIEYAEKELSISRLLISKDLRAHAGEVFLDRYGELISLSKSGQLAMRRVLEEHLGRVEWDQWMFPIRLYPFISELDKKDRPIVIDPNISFGRPIVARAGISTAVIAKRIDAGESVEELADDYDLNFEEIESSILYERAA